MAVRASIGGAEIPVDNPAVIIVDINGVPQAVGGGGGGGGATANDIGAATNAAMKSSNQPISATALPLPTGAATEVTQLAVLAQLQGDRAITSNLFIDSTSTTYLRVLAFNQQTNTYEATVLTLAGAPYTPVPPETSLAKSDLDTTETSWEIRVSGTGYTVGDIVSQFNFLSQSPPAVIATLWFNQTTQLALASAPLAAHRRRTDGLAATEATLTTRLSEGTPITGEVLEAGGTGGVGWFSSIRKAITAIANYFNPTVVQAGGIGPTFADIPVTGKLRRVVVQNRSGATLFLQFHQKALPLTTSDVPLNGQIYQVANNGQVILAAADYGLHGTTAPTNTRLGLSTTFGTYTAHASTNASLFVETI
jgi:hypothetical protein